MFVQSKKTVKIVGAVLVLSVMSTAGATAGNTNGYQVQGGTIPVAVDLSNVQTAAGPIYISIQKKDQYMGMKGFGGVIKTAVQGNMSVTYNVDVPGEYAVSVWHDINDNGVFDMDDKYRPLEGYGSTGNIPLDRRPIFDDVKVNIPHAGAQINVGLKYKS